MTIAVVPSTEYEIRKVYPQDVTASASSGFVPAVVCDDFVFVAGQMANIHFRRARSGHDIDFAPALDGAGADRRKST